MSYSKDNVKIIKPEIISYTMNKEKNSWNPEILKLKPTEYKYFAKNYKIISQSGTL